MKKEEKITNSGKNTANHTDLYSPSIIAFIGCMNDNVIPRRASFLETTKLCVHNSIWMLCLFILTERSFKTAVLRNRDVGGRGEG